MKKTSKPKLLTRETLRTLAAPQLDDVRGGAPTGTTEIPTWFICVSESFTVFCPRSFL